MLGTIIKNHRENLNMSKRELAQKLEVHESSISKYEKNEVDLPLSKFKQISKILKINPLELLEMEEYISYNQIEDNPLNIPTTTMEYYENICVNCSSPILPEYSDVEVQEISLPNAILGEIAGKTNLVAIKSRGDSMDKIIPDGSFIIIKKLIAYEQPQNGDIVLYSFEDSWSIKEFVKEKDKVIFRPHSNNPKHKDNIYKFEDMENGMEIPVIIGKVVYYGVSL